MKFALILLLAFNGQLHAFTMDSGLSAEDCAAIVSPATYCQEETR